ncbi:MAG TPA: phosphate ABC transporter permease subunit PstC [Armatimonadota bacterium]|nr:phosphate ABC transporter permease subunit PstC [Armatimonadota bacterium]
MVKPILFFCAAISVLTTAAIVLVLLSESLMFFAKVPFYRFLTDRYWTPLFAQKQFGIASLVCGTLLTSGVALLVATPLGLLIAVYLSEYATPGVRGWVKPLLEFLSGIPTVVYGYFALLFLTPILQRFIPGLEPFNALSAGLVMGFMILPLVASLSEDALYAVPTGLRYAAYGLGYTRLQAVWKIVMPAALSGITAAIILALSRAVGETMIVAVAAGMQPTLTLNPLQAVETLTAYIVQVTMGDVPHGTLEYHTIFVVGLTLFTMTLVLNSIALWLRERFRSIYS